MPAKNKGRPGGPAASEDVAITATRRATENPAGLGKPCKAFSPHPLIQCGGALGSRRGQLSLESLIVIAIVILVSAGGYSIFSAINKNLDGQKGLFLAMSQAEGAAMILGEAANFGVPFEIKTNLTQGVDRVFGNRLFVRLDGVEGSAPVAGMPDSLVNKGGDFLSYER